MIRIYRGVDSYNAGEHVVNSAMVSGTAVQLESLTGNTLVAATGVPLGIIMKTVSTTGVGDFQLETLVGKEAYEVITGSPVPVVWGPGELLTDRVHSSMTGAAQNAALTISAGVWKPATSADEICGRLVGKNKDGTTGTYLIEVLLGGGNDSTIA